MLKNIKLVLFVALLALVAVVSIILFSFNSSNRAKMAERAKQVQEGVRDITQPILRSQYEVSAAPSVEPRKETPRVPAPRAVTPVKAAPMRVYTGKVSVPEQEPLGDYAPYGRLVKCELVNTVDSATLSTPIIGLVSEDIVWDGKVIIPRRSEVHGTAQLDSTRERIGSEGLFTFVLNDPQDPGLGKELVVKGVVLDREEDPTFKTFGITDGSAGLRGVVIKTDKLAEVKLFIATFLSGISEGLQSTSTTVFGVQANPNGNTAGIPGYVINPAAQGTQNVLNMYAQQILNAIQRDGFFIRVEAGKQFYVYIRQAVDLNKATIAGDMVRQQMKKDYLDDRSTDEQISEPRTVRDREHEEQISRESNPYLNGWTRSLDNPQYPAQPPQNPQTPSQRQPDQSQTISNLLPASTPYPAGGTNP